MVQKLRRLALLMLVAAMLTTCLSGCFTFSFPDLLGGNSTEDTSGGPLFDPDGNDDPLNDAAEATGASTLPTEKQDPTEEPTEKATEPTEETEAPTEKPTEEPTQPADPLPANPIAYGVVTGDVVNVRKGPGTNYGVNRLIYENARIAIYERKGDWGRMADGWISLNYVYIDGTVGPDGSVMGTVDGMTVRIRSGPGTKYDVQRVVDTGDRLEILFYSTFDGREWGCTKYGWICMDYVILDS